MDFHGPKCFCCYHQILSSAANSLSLALVYSLVESKMLLMLVRKPINQTQECPRIGLPPKFGKISNPKIKLLCNSGLQFDVCCYLNFHSPQLRKKKLSFLCGCLSQSEIPQSPKNHLRAPPKLCFQNEV